MSRDLAESSASLRLPLWECTLFRRLYGCLDPGTQLTPALTHPVHGFPLSQRTFLCLQSTQEYSCCGPEPRSCA